ncbi:MAG: LysR family transcriptional regulator [Pseudomonadota bacterium]
MQHLTTLRFIDAIARAGSIRRAASDMNITPSALNRRLLAVEEELDAPLFERLPAGVRPSAAGELFLVHARRQLADMERMRSKIEDMKGARFGHVNFGFDEALVAEGFGEAVQVYRSQHDAVSFNIQRYRADDVQTALDEYRIDLASIVDPVASTTITTLATAPVSVAAIMSPRHPLAQRGTVTFNDLLAFPLVLPPKGSLRRVLERGAARQDFTLRPMLECDLRFAAATLRETDAIGFQANTSTRHEVSLPNAVAVPIRTRDVPNPMLHLVQLRGRSLSVAASRFADMLLQRFARYSGEV